MSEKGETTDNGAQNGHVVCFLSFFMMMKSCDDEGALNSPVHPPPRRTTSLPTRRSYTQLSKLNHIFGDVVPLNHLEAKQVAKVNKFFGADFPSNFFDAQNPRQRPPRKSNLPLYFKHAASNFLEPKSAPAGLDIADSGFDSDDEMGMSDARKNSNAESTAPKVSHQRKWNSESDPGNFVKKTVCPDSATFEEMVDFFIDPRLYFGSDDVDAFILCLPSFSNPLNLMSVLRERFNASKDSTEKSPEKEKILGMRLRKIKILEFLNDWLRSVSGMEDLRDCAKLQQNVRTFLEEKDCDLVSL